MKRCQSITFGCFDDENYKWLITHADDSRVNMAISAVCDSVCVCLSVCPHDKTKTTETKTIKLGTGIVHHDTSPTKQ